MTDDMIQHQGRSTSLPEADIACRRHTHGSFTREVARVRVRHDGAISQDIQTHVKVLIYMQDYRDGFSEWHATTGNPPNPIGAWWVCFHWCNKRQHVLYELTRAQ